MSNDTEALTLADFLLARITEAEGILSRVHDDEDGLVWVGTETGPKMGVGLKRLLAECEAKRRIVAIHEDGGESQGYVDSGYGYYEHACLECGTFGEYGCSWPCQTIRALALPYADHPDYRDEWRP